MNFIPTVTIAKKEIGHVFKLPFQVLGAPIATTVLYFLVFGHAIGGRLGAIQGISYTEFIMPGLIMMNMITGAFNGVFSSMILAKYMNTFNDLLVSPMSYLEIIMGFVIGSVGRSIITAGAIYLTALFFVPFHIGHPFFILLMLILVGACFALLGFLVGVVADNFEHASVFPNFIIMPLSFLGGIFYSAEMLPAFAQRLTYYNPLFYMINGMRYGFFGISDVMPVTAFAVVMALFVVMLGATWQLVRSGYKLKN
ncbi:MAG: ABC transporter permease [Candidatus Komeilibacteria bacterium]|nr:ABC transporter permease [Candidatus Komeilibacteria bacterium]